MVLNPKLCLVAGILCISFSPIFVKVAGTAPLAAAFYRVFVACLCLLPYCLVRSKLKVSQRQLIIAMTAGVVFALDIAVWHLSLLKISATISTLIANLAPVWVGLLSLLLLKKKSGGMFWAGTGIAIAGMILLVGYKQIIHLEFNAGILLALLSSLFYAAYILISKNVMQGIDVFSFTFYSMLGASAFLLMINLYTGGNILDHPLPVWLCFIGNGLLCQLAGWLAINYALRYLESTKVSITLLSQTVFTGLLAVFLLNERLTVTEMAGSVIVLAGIAITFLRPRNKLIAG